MAERLLLSTRDLALVDAIAQRVIELLDARHQRACAGELVDAAALARLLGVERGWVYRHAHELGAVRLGGEKGRLRFDSEQAKRAMHCQNGKQSHAENTSNGKPPALGRPTRKRRLPNGLPEPGSVLVARVPYPEFDHRADELGKTRHIPTPQRPVGRRRS